MFLRNYYNLMARVNLGYKNTIGSGFGDGSLSIRDNEGKIYNSIAGSVSSYYYTLPRLGDISYIGNAYSNWNSIGFGTGNEPVTFEDYNFGTPISGKLSYSAVSIGKLTYNQNEKKYYGINKYTISNSSSEEIIIREYGINCSIPYSNGGISVFLIYRELIEPYSLQPSESVNVFLNYTYTMPTIDESGNVVAGSQTYGLNIE